ncbi:MAG: ribosome rescue protein RqcH [Candidatus Bathyarchaeia archaeon]
MREGISSFDIAVIAAELSKFIKGSRIGKIYQINHKILLLKLRNPKGENTQLLIEAGKRIHLTSYDFEKPKKPPVFCMALRKHLENGVIDGVTQYDFERIIEISVKSGGQNYRLIIEFFEKGNIMLVGPENKILHALTYRKMRDRNILRGEEFKYPPMRGINLKSINLDEVRKIRELSQIEVVRGLTRFLGIGGFYAEEILLRSGIDKSKPCFSLTDEELEAIFRNIMALLSQIENGDYRPCIFIGENNEWIDVAPFPLKKYSNFRVIEMETFNRALDEYYAKTSVKLGAEEIEDSTKREIDSLERILEEQRRSLSDLRGKANFYRRIGDTIFSHLYELDTLISRVMNEKRNGKKWDEIIEMLLREKKSSLTPANYFVSINPETLTLQVSVDGQEFNLNLKTTAQQNASEYYEMAKRVEDKIDGIEKAIEQTIEKIEEVKAKASKRIETLSKPPIPRRKEWYEKFRWFFSSEGFLVIGGRDAATNETVIRKYMEDRDIVFHADISGSPFVVVKTQGKEPAEKTIIEAAQFTASYSRAWREQIRAIDVYWVKPEQVSKTPPSGEYLPRGSFMIYGNKNYIRNVPLEIAIGIKRDKDGPRVIGGPVEAIAEQTNLYVKIIPGDETSGKLAKDIRGTLANMASPEEREEILKIPLEEIQAFIPLGRGSISNK